MKKLFISFFLIIILAMLAGEAIAAGNTNSCRKEAELYKLSTNDKKLYKALESMKGTSAEWAMDAILGQNVLDKPIIIDFKDFSEISDKNNTNYANFDALGWRKNNTHYIYINKNHKNAPVEALAAVLSHEAVHQDEYCSMEEETYAWSYEADVWIQMLRKKPALASIKHPLVERLNMLAKLFVEGDYTADKIRSLVYSNREYQDFPLNSSGF